MISGSIGSLFFWIQIDPVIAQLWPLYRGRLSRPNVGDILYIPQRSYLVIGTLRDQIIYPFSHADMIRANRTDEELLEILRRVQLAYIPERVGGWETKNGKMYFWWRKAEA
ncbi:hypothetical protein Glove_63g98 [Diversispora epigaea]|uniref:Uncharacterized protein n=1 Tax=Diversispora epigaea TaxID=1348612 RepID=A0A397JMF4_9GLOM|nr:hypothetical protein Glove_63g98 [Diversispora epigaea]